VNLDILSQNLLIVFCIIFSVLSFYVISILYKHQPTFPKKTKAAVKKAALIRYRKLNRYVFGAAVLFCLIFSVLLYVLVGHFTDSPLPVSFILMCLPFSLLLGVLPISIFIKKKLIILSSVAVVVSLLFSLLIINNYYRFYPTFGEIFGITDVAALKDNLNSVTVNYKVPINQQLYNSKSIQSSLENLPGPSTNGQIYQINMPGTVSKFNPRAEYVYVPAIYKSPINISLPVIVLTAGVPGIPENWVGLGLQNIMDQFAKSHDGITPLVFVADSTGTISNDTECVNSPRGNVETYLSVDVPNYIRHHFRVDDSPKNWAIGGLSMGGMCAIMLTLRHPNVYNYFIDLGGEAGPEVGSQQQTIDALFGGSEQNWAAHQPLMLLANHKYPNIGGFFGDGAQDNISVVNGISELNAASQKAGIDSVSETVNGAHTFNVWAETYKDSLPWISNRIGATQCSAGCI
jgi:enterochelin esterase-like enzyme